MAPPDLSGLRVLIVEDHRDSADMLCQSLGFYGAETRAEHRAETALEVARTYRPHIVITDMHLAGNLDGLWLVHKIQAEPGRLGNTPVIAVTGERFLSPERMRPFSGVIVKPIDIDRLAELLSTFAADLGLR